MMPDPRASCACVWVAGMVNALVDGPKVVMAKPFGPRDGGTDLFESDVQAKFAGIGLTGLFLDDWNTYHRMEGEIHCGTNGKRSPPANVKWWE